MLQKLSKTGQSCSRLWHSASKQELAIRQMPQEQLEFRDFSNNLWHFILAKKTYATNIAVKWGILTYFVAYDCCRHPPPATGTRLIAPSVCLSSCPLPTGRRVRRTWKRLLKGRCGYGRLCQGRASPEDPGAESERGD